MSNDRPMTQAEILDQIKQLDSISGDPPYKSVSSVLSTKVNSQDTFGAYKPKGRGKMFYGLLGWFDKQGNILPQYDPDNIMWVGLNEAN